MQRNAQLTAALTADLIVVAALAPGAPRPGKKRGGVPPSPPAPAALVAQGHGLFLTNCSPCHGADAEGDDGPNLHHKGLPDSFIASTLDNGIKGEMPPFGGKLKAPEVKALVAYVHSFQK